jgi:hypothetical protein
MGCGIPQPTQSSARIVAKAPGFKSTLRHAAIAFLSARCFSQQLRPIPGVVVEARSVLFAGQDANNATERIAEAPLLRQARKSWRLVRIDKKCVNPKPLAGHSSQRRTVPTWGEAGGRVRPRRLVWEDQVMVTNMIARRHQSSV